MKFLSAGHSGFSVRVTLAALLAVVPLAGAGEHGPVDLHRPALADLGSGDTLTGNWGGARTALSDHGITITANYTGEVLGNVRGGIRKGAIYDALLIFGADIDAGKWIGWSGANFHVTACYPHGASLSSLYTGDLGLVSNIDAYDSLRLYEAWFEQNLFGDRFSLRAGFLAADAEFGVMDLATPFIHSNFGPPGVVSNDFPSATYPYSALGVRLRIQPAPGWSVLFGIYDGNPAPGVFPDPSPGAAPSNEFNHWGTHFALRHDEGAMLFAEIGWRLNPPPKGDKSDNGGDDGKAEKSEGPGPRPLAGSYKVGGVYHTDEFSDIGDVTLGRANPRGVRGDSAFYLSAEQEVWREPGTKADGLAAFARVAFAPGDRNLFQHTVEAGLVYAGLWQSDAHDHLALGASWADISDDVASAQRRAGIPEQDYEAVVELTYEYQLTKWCMLQPDVQWVIHPGGSSVLRDALVLGWRVTLTF